MIDKKYTNLIFNTHNNNLFLMISDIIRNKTGFRFINLTKIQYINNDKFELCIHNEGINKDRSDVPDMVPKLNEDVLFEYSDKVYNCNICNITYGNLFDYRDKWNSYSTIEVNNCKIINKKL